MNDFVSNFMTSFEKRKKDRGGIPGFEMNSPFGVRTRFNGHIGLELEVEAQRPLPRDQHLEDIKSSKGARWTTVADGSLRGEAREYILTKPCFVEDVPGLVNGLFQAFEDRGSIINNSNRCSTHVHINMAGQRVNVLTSIIAMWGIFEPLLVEWCGEERKTNHFALGYKDATGLPRAWENFLNTGRTIAENTNLKYAALNYLPLWTLGSIEFRCGGAPDSAERVITWTTFIHTFVEYVKANYQNPTRIAYDVSERGGIEILRDICGTKLQGFFAELMSVRATDAINREFIDNFREVQSLCLAFPWDDWMSTIEEEYVVNPFATKTKGGRRRTINQPLDEFIDRLAEQEAAVPPPLNEPQQDPRVFRGWEEVRVVERPLEPNANQFNINMLREANELMARARIINNDEGN